MGALSGCLTVVSVTGGPYWRPFNGYITKKLTMYPLNRSHISVWIKDATVRHPSQPSFNIYMRSFTPKTDVNSA